jgi:hypothetical protein
MENVVATTREGNNDEADRLHRRRTTIELAKDLAAAAASSPPGSTYDVRYLLRDVREVLVLALRRNRARRTEDRQFLFWTTWQAHAIYASVGLAAFTGKFALLSLGAAVIVLQIVWVVLKWTYYIRDDRQVDQFVDFCSTWIKRVLREGEKIFKGRDAVSYVMAFSVIRAAPTGFLYARYIMRYNLRRANAQILLEASERFGNLVEHVDPGNVVSSTISRGAEAITGSAPGGQQRAKQFAATRSFRQSRNFDYGVYDMPIEMDLDGIIQDDGPRKRQRDKAK